MTGAEPTDPDAGPAHRRAPALSVVIASRSVERPPHDCVAAVLAQADGSGQHIEVILVDDGATRIEVPPGVNRIVAPDCLVPELWAEGLRHASGELVALLASTVVPDPEWMAQVLASHSDGQVAVGGAIEPGRQLGVVDWAVYFCRYSAYMLPLAGGPASDFAGDNASYRREVLDRYRHLYERAFSEPFVHRAMLADGLRLHITPDRIVRHVGGTTARQFRRQRYRHGRDYGELRSTGEHEVPGAVRAGATAVLVPGLLTLRAAITVARKGRSRGRFVAAAPLMAYFYSWWAAGELAGRLCRGRRRHRR